MEIKVVHIPSTSQGLDNLIDGGQYTGKIGWTANAIHENVNPRTGQITSQLVAQSALDNEFGKAIKGVNGAGTIIPPRPFLRNTIRRESQNWLDAMSAGAEAVLNNSISFEKVLDDVTKKAVNDVRDTVRSRVEPELSPYTVKQRRIKRAQSYTSIAPTGDLPLYDTGHMMQTLENEVTTEAQDV